MIRPKKWNQDEPWKSMSSEERNYGMLCHLLAFAGCFVPFGHVLGPLVMWLLKREEFTFVNDEGKSSLNFQISISIYAAISAILTIIYIGPFLLMGLIIFDVVEVIIASIAASNGRSHDYPLSIEFIK